MDKPLRLGLTFAAWIGATFLVSVAAWLLGAELRSVCNAAVLALSPAVAGFILLNRLSERWARSYVVLAWALAATMLAASSGGAASPASTLFVAAPAIALVVGGARLIAIGAFASGAGYVAAAWVGEVAEPASLGWTPSFYAAAALFLCALLFLTQKQSQATAGDPDQRIAEAAHELRTPLSHMIGFAEMIEKEIYGPVGDRNRDYAGLIRESGLQLLDMIGRRLDLARIAAGRRDLSLETFDAREIAADVARLSQGSAAAKNITLEQDIPEGEFVVCADRDAMRQILTNLLGNALKFTPEGGRVRLALRRLGAKLHLEVSDTGPGVAPSERTRLMRPFERGARARRIEGAGLGLALVRALARLHGGDLRLAEAQGGGLLAQVRLPVGKVN
jgi:signal transduction histidine kinase